MIDPGLINPIAKEGLKLLAQSGLLRAQIAADKDSLLHGSPDEHDAGLIESIRQFRQKAVLLESLHELGENFVKENES